MAWPLRIASTRNVRFRCAHACQHMAGFSREGGRHGLTVAIKAECRIGPSRTQAVIELESAAPGKPLGLAGSRPGSAEISACIT